MIITVDILKKIAPGCRRSNIGRLNSIAYFMNMWFPDFGIDTRGEVCHFIAQAAHETGSFNFMLEIASGDDYDTRVDLGNTPEKDGDGRRLKGRGIFQTTGGFNYKKVTYEWNKAHPHDRLDFYQNPQLLELPQYAVWSACQYWDQRDLNTFANMPDSSGLWVKKYKKNLSPVEYITYRINGGQNHIKERKEFYERAKLVFQ